MFGGVCNLVGVVCFCLGGVRGFGFCLILLYVLCISGIVMIGNVCCRWFCFCLVFVGRQVWVGF